MRDPETLGDHLHKRRLHLGLRQIDVAQQLGVDIQCISNWECHRSNPKTYLIPRIVEFLGYSPFEQPNSFPEILRAHRRAAGLSQERLPSAKPSTVPELELEAIVDHDRPQLDERQLLDPLGSVPFVRSLHSL